ncbi:MAG: hypothetical protein QXM96_01625 [Candidatus Woesearchaeota archaeon]
MKKKILKIKIIAYIIYCLFVKKRDKLYVINFKILNNILDYCRFLNYDKITININKKHDDFKIYIIMEEYPEVEEKINFILNFYDFLFKTKKIGSLFIKKTNDDFII